MRRVLPALAPLAFPFALACGSTPAYPSRDCALAIWALPSQPGSSLAIVGSWDGWAGPVPMAPSGEGDFLVLRPSLAPGEYGYLVVEDGTTRLDPYQPLSTYRGDQEVSLLLVDDCHAPALRVDAVTAADAGQLSVAGVFLAGSQGSPLDPTSLHASVAGGPALHVATADPATGRFTLTASGLAQGKYTVSIGAADAAGSAAAPARAAAWVKPAMVSWGDGFLYQIMIDRYRGDGGKPLAPPETPGSRAGGTLGGVLAAIEAGTFERLGVTALWLSPVYPNPTEARPGLDGHLYEGYHGYWPEGSRTVEPRFGGEAAFRAVLDAAHRRGLRVLLDVVPHHVYEKNPRYLGHERDDWFAHGPGSCVCGTASCGWGLTCWFASYLPSVRFQEDGQMQESVADALFWRDTFDLDGFRIDAVPMMPRSAMRRVTRGLRDTLFPREASFSVGEVFTGPGVGAIQDLRYELGPDGLDSAFDFPLMWAVRDALATGQGGFDGVEQILAATEATLAGSGSLVGRMIGNHDTTRFASEADGTAGGSAWSDPPRQPSDPEVYARQGAALALMLTLPGYPVLYYGDEVGLAGGGDPDSRRVMPADAALSAAQNGVLRMVQRLGTLRGCSAALRAGARATLAVTADTYAFSRDAGDGSPVVVVLSRAAGSLTVPVPAALAGGYVDVLSGDVVPLPGPVGFGGLGVRVLVPEASPCR